MGHKLVYTVEIHFMVQRLNQKLTGSAPSFNDGDRCCPFQLSTPLITGL